MLYVNFLLLSLGGYFISQVCLNIVAIPGRKLSQFADRNPNHKSAGQYFVSGRILDFILIQTIIPVIYGLLLAFFYASHRSQMSHPWVYCVTSLVLAGTPFSLKLTINARSQMHCFATISFVIGIFILPHLI